MQRLAAVLLAATLVVGCQRQEGVTTTQHRGATAVVQPKNTAVRQGSNLRFVQDAVIECFPSGTTKASGKPATCELSGVTAAGGELIFANDKSIPGPSRSTMLGYGASEQYQHMPAGLPTRYLRSEVVSQVRKLEDLTTTADGAMVIATTAFDRPNSETKKNGNALIYWPTKTPAAARLKKKVRIDGGNKQEVRQCLRAALADDDFPEGPPYFKVEGLSTVPKGRLFIGVREQGQSYRDFAYTITLVELHYTVSDDGASARLRLHGPCQRILHIDGAELAAADHRLDAPVAVSSLAFDAERSSLIVLASFETEATVEGLGGYLFEISASRLGGELTLGSLALLGESQGPNPAARMSFRPLSFSHKPEGVVPLPSGRLLVVYDDDRVTGSFRVGGANGDITQVRALNQSYYSVLKWAP